MPTAPTRRSSPCATTTACASRPTPKSIARRNIWRAARTSSASKIIKPRENHNAYSVHFYEPGGNYWEIESYEHAVEHGMGKTTNPHWTKPLAAETFAGKGYVPQALTHGTLGE